MCKDCKKIEKYFELAKKAISDLGYSRTARIDARKWDEYFRKHCLLKKKKK